MMPTSLRCDVIDCSLNRMAAGNQIKGGKLLIALDYDETYTLDPEFWDMVIAAAQYRGHTVICATMRHEHEGDEIIAALGKKVERVIFTGRKAKHRFVQEFGYYPSVWVDDSPHWLYQDSK